MYWLKRHADFEANKGRQNKRAMKKLVTAGTVPGILAYQREKPVGWCAVGPRDGYIRLETSRILKPADDQPVWSIVCLFIAKEHRRQGLSERLLQAATAFAKKNKARIVEGYPRDLTGRKPQPDPFVWTGLVQSYEKVGFEEVLRRSPGRPIMRYYLAR